MRCQKVDPGLKEELVAFLKRYEEYTLFLLNNLENYGMELSEALYSGNYKMIRVNGDIVAVFCLQREGMLLIQSTVQSPELFRSVLTACLEETMAIKGLLGEWNFCHAFWEFLKEKKVIREEMYKCREILYTLPLSESAYVAQSATRLLTPEDFEEWKELRLSYIEEKGIPSHSLEEIRKEFLEKAEKGITWGLFLDGKMVSIADLNACALDLGQVGGVYTDPAFRRQGLSKQVMHQLIEDAKERQHLRKLIIFTGENNLPARKVYESLGAKPFGYYGLFFAK